jgi:C4-type Zn-finger protein
MKTDKNGCSTCAVGSEQYEIFHMFGKKLVKNIRCQCDYRHTDGDLFSCIARDLESAREKRDEWLNNKD